MDIPALKTILCPVDFSELSAHALRHAGMLAECASAKVVAVYADWFEAPAYFTAGRVEALQQQFRDAVGEAERSLKAFVNSTLGVRAVEVETRIVEALPVDGIRQLAADTGADLIVMGTHGRSGFNRWMLGSVTERVLREVPIPLLTVRAAPRGPIRRILSALDGTGASRNAFALAIRLGACLHAEVAALYVQEDVSAPVPELCQWISDEERERCSIREVVRHGDPAAEIVALAAKEEFDLLVIGAPHRPFFEGLILGSTTLRAVRHAPCPVLAVSGPGKLVDA